MGMQMMMFVTLVVFVVVCMGVSCSSKMMVKIGELEAMEMDSEINKRMLYGIEEKRYISYGALKNEAVPCSTPGAPYYNCHGGGSNPANTYSRGCEIITRCARDASP
ncbi:protein RALF-like 22 [Dioscorea cayenensis subsp. rotundata]|uniref:Protein RALF-like 22 n=1 Tax=Dioscorea cayennensis subsp. rotundata TaxID=55577 RepID=A0AB40B8I2_DIOCR|nr:protein RALF-like 22 [Dioscorea cayenensis subsp. rotundata]